MSPASCELHASPGSPSSGIGSPHETEWPPPPPVLSKLPTAKTSILSWVYPSAWQRTRPTDRVLWRDHSSGLSKENKLFLEALERSGRTTQMLEEKSFMLLNTAYGLMNL
ncbi:hypothetical protein Y1Q_0017674 [Alligator mississippiensis]|uniref:Uncharacterized protein n=1 Tax=Alligator mississippiensis TaxID=8496 RepID=A0A151NFR2_ALLMI|nr:hypothetical protein Y1Q_0017674 [Alligator mississippiensis]